MSELNPNHPVLRYKLGKTELEITASDIDSLSASGMANIVIDCRGGRCVLRLVSDKEAVRLARQEGGLPA